MSLYNVDFIDLTVKNLQTQKSNIESNTFQHSTTDGFQLDTFE